jgi:hypothetical protein
MATLAGSVTVNPTTGVATGSGMALALYNVMLASATYAGIAVDPSVGMTTARVAQGRIQLAEICNSFATIADGAQWILTAIKTANYNASKWELVLCNPTSAGFFVSLPNAAALPPGVSVRVKNTTTSTNTITVNTFGGLIDNVTTYVLNLAGQGVEFTSDGTNWWMTAKFS